VRGLKSKGQYKDTVDALSHPAWGAWIEIDEEDDDDLENLQSHPAWGAWIEILISARYFL